MMLDLARVRDVMKVDPRASRAYAEICGATVEPDDESLTEMMTRI